MKKLKLLLMAAALLGASQTWAQTDVTSTYITNAGFDTESDFQTSIAVDGSAHRYDVTGWTNEGGTQYTSGGAIKIGNGKINGADVPSTNAEGTTTGGVLAIQAAWASNVFYKQDVTLPAGNYTMTFAVNNVGKNAQFEKDPVMFSFTTTDGSSFSGNVHSYPVNEWTTQTISFALASETSGTIKIGYKGSNNQGSGATPKLIIDYVKAVYNSNYTATLQSAIDRATILNARASDDDLAAAITTAQGVLDAADNTVAYQATINSAVTTLRSAINTAASKVVLLEGENITFMFENADFESGTPVTVGITTYDYDAAQNGTNYSRMQVVEGWTIAANGNAKSAGIYKFGETTWLGSTGDSYQAPASGSATGEEKALGIVAVWSSSAQYKQDCTLPAGSYIIEVPVYNTAGTTAFNKNLIGFVENGGIEHLATAKTYTTGSWITEKIIFELANETAGYLSLGYTAANSGSGAMPHLFIDGVKVTYTSPIAAAYQKYQDALQAAQNAIGNSDYDNVTGDERTDLQNAIDATPAQTKEAYNDAADALDAAREAFTDAKANYDAFVAAKATVVPDLTYAAAAKKTALTDAIAATASTSAEAATNATAITTALRAYYESNALAEGVAGAENMTSNITNAANPSNTNGWTLTNTTGNSNMRTMTNEPWTNSDDTTPSSYFDTNSWGTAFATTMTQDVTLEAGKYLLSVMARGNGTTTYQLTAKDQATDIAAIGSNGGAFGRGWNSYTVEFEVTEDEAGATIGMNMETGNSGNWLSFGDFKLVQLSKTDVPMAGETEYAALNAAIEAAETHTLGFDANEYAPYNNIAALEALATAKAFDTAVENRKKLVVAATTALNNATWTANTTEVDAIYDGTLANAPIQATSENVVLPGWVTKTGNTRQTFSGTGEGGKACLADAEDQVGLFVHPGTYNYGETVGYTMPLKAGVLYQAEAKYCAWQESSNLNFTLTILKDNSTIATQSFGKVEATVDEEHALKAVKLYFEVEEDGNYILSVIPNGNTFMTDFHLKKAVAEDVTIAEDNTYTPAKKYANVTFNREFKAGWNGAVLPFDMTIEEVKTAFSASAVKDFSGVTVNADGSATLNFEDATEVKAGKPFVMKNSAEGQSYTINGIILPATALQTVEKFDGNVKYTFTGGYAAKTDLDDVNFALINAGKFYYHTAGKNSSSAKAFRAWFVNNSTDGTNGGARVTFNFGDDVITGISEVNANFNADLDGIYNLQGQRVANAKKGLFIQNGKKVVRK